MKLAENRCRKSVLIAVAVSAALSGYAAVQSDLLCSYPPSTAAAWGGEANTRVTIANQVIGSNALNDQSGTGESMNIVGYFMSSRDSSGEDNGTVLGLVAGDAAYADVRNYAASVGADQVLYIPYASTGAAGNAYQPGTYSAVNSTWWWMVVFAHETGGHNYGCAHGDDHLSPKGIMMHNYCGGGATYPYFYGNPNIWQSGVNLLGDGVSCLGGSLISGGDNANRISSSAQGMCDTTLRVVYGPVLNNAVYHWCFTNSAGSAPASTTNYDLVSGAPAVVRGNGATYTGSALRIPGGTPGNVAMSSMSAYIDLPNGIISSQTNLTIEVWATPLSAPNWARILDFGRCTESGDGLGAPGEYTGAISDPAPSSTTGYDEVLLSCANGSADITQQRFMVGINGSFSTLDSSLATTAGVQHHYAITFTDGAGSYTTNGGRWQWYRDGVVVTFLDVNYHLASIHDVDNWLGRSLWSGDSNANNDYAEVRISNVAMNQFQVMANCLVGPNYIQRSTTLTYSDLWNGGTRSFNTTGYWSDGLAPSAGKSYEMSDFNVTTPNTTTPYTFAGDSLHASGGIFFDGASGSSTITINKFQIDNEEICNTASGTFMLAGNLYATNNNILRGSGGPLNVSANLNGNGSLTLYGQPVSLTGNNTNFTGKIRVGNGITGALNLSSEAQLGANPPSYTADQLIFNRGWLYATATFSISNSNRGILIGANDAIIDVASGTTLTIASPLSCGITATSGNQLVTQSQISGVVAGAIIKQNSGTLVLNSSNSGFTGLLDVDSGSTSANDGAVRIANSSVMANAFSPIYLRNNNSGSSTLQLDGASGGVTLAQNISVSGRNNSSVAIENIAGTNWLNGGLALNSGGANYVVQVDTGALNLAGTVTATASGTRTLTVQGAGTANFNGTLTDGSGTLGVNKSGSGTLNFGAGSTFSGATTVSQGTFALAATPTTPVLRLSFNNAAGSGNGSIITNTGSGGAAMNGTLVTSGGASIVTGGKFGNALSLNGSGGTTAANIVLITNKCVLTDATGSWTVGYWIKTSTAGAEIMYQGDGTWLSSGQTTYLLNANAGSTAGTKAGAVRWAGGFLTGTTALNNNAWHFVTLVDNAGTETIYVDGSVDTVTSTMGLPLASNASQTWIGGAPDSDSGAVRMNGLIDEVVMFNRALSQAEVQSLYANNAITNSSVNVLPAATPVTVASSGMFDLAGVSQTVAGLSGGGIVTNSGGAATLTVSNASGSTLFSGKISDASAGNAVSFTKNGGGTEILAGANSFRGATTVNGGTLKLSPVVDDSILHLTFNNAATSASGTVITNTGLGGAALNGTLVTTGGASIASGGRFGNALSLNGVGSNASNNIVVITNSVLDTSAAGTWTVSYWIKTSTAGAVIMYQGDGTWSSSGQTMFYLNSNGTSSGTKAGAVRWAGGWLTGTTALNNNAWHFVTLVDNAGTESIYVDGSVDAVTSTMGLSLASGANQIWIGGSPDGGDGAVKMTGLIDEVYMFNRALSQAEVQSLYNNNSLSTNSGNVLPSATPLMIASGAMLDVGGVSQTVASLAGSGSVTNSSSAATLTLSNSTGTATFSGSIGDTSLANALSLVQNGGATNIFSGANTYRGATVVNGGALFVNGTLGSGAVTNAALLGGNGTLGGALTVSSGGTISPGTGVGKMTVNSSVTLSSGSTTFMEISKSPKTNDQLVASGALNCGGTLVVTNLAGTLAGGDAFKLFQAGSFNGSFAANSLPALGVGLAWNTSSLSSGILSVVQTAPTNLMCAVSGTNLSLSWPGDYVGWRLLVQTNHLAGGVSQNTNDWGTVATSPQTNQIVLPFAPALSAEFYRLVYP